MTLNFSWLISELRRTSFLLVVVAEVTVVTLACCSNDANLGGGLGLRNRGKDGGCLAERETAFSFITTLSLYKTVGRYAAGRLCVTMAIKWLRNLARSGAFIRVQGVMCAVTFAESNQWHGLRDTARHNELYLQQYEHYSDQHH